MSRNPAVGISEEHNRGPTTSARARHRGWAVWTPVHGWVTNPPRRGWAAPLLYGLVAVLLLWPLDGWLSTVLAPAGQAHAWLGPDLRRELEALQQFGQGAITVAIGITIWVMDPGRRRALLDWLAAIGIGALIAFGLKMLLGRPRPVLEEPDLLLGPFGVYPLGPGLGVAHAWEFWNERASMLWSMPSSHTAYAVIAAGMLASWYPRLRWLMAALVAAVATGRLLLGAHYVSDVAAGLAVGLISLGLARRWRPSGRRAELPGGAG
jgi:membrane-associated phospholipid phosphatase